MKKYTNKMLMGLIIVIILAALSVPLFTWLSRGSSNIQFNSDNTQISAKSLSYKGFNAIDISGTWQVQILPGEFAISLSNPEDAQYIALNGQVLQLGSARSLQRDDSPKVVIHLPDITRLSMSGADTVYLSNFKQKNLNPLKLDLSGATKLIANSTNYKNIIITMSGASNVSFKNSELEQVELNTSGVSKLELDTFVQGKLSGQVSGATSISYSGTITGNTIESSGVVNIRKK